MPAPKRPKLSPEEQHSKFVETARQLGADESQERFNQKLAKVARARVDESELPKPESATK